MLRVYNLHARIISWSSKWLYVQGVFTLPASKSAVKKQRQLPTMISNLNADPGICSGTSTPTLGGLETPSTSTLNGETICAVIYGRYVFKRPNRETVPVHEVLELSGYTGDDEIEKRRADGWEYVKGLEHDWERARALQSARDI